MTPHDIYRIRHAEVFTALGCLVMGAWLLRDVESMATATYGQLLAMASEQTWGAIFLLLGIIHGLSLYINGARWWTPFFRLATCVGGVALYGAFVLGFWIASPNTTAVPAYSVWGVLMSASCAYRAYVDAITGARRKHHGIA